MLSISTEISLVDRLFLSHVVSPFAVGISSGMNSVKGSVQQNRNKKWWGKVMRFSWSKPTRFLRASRW
jgi:hypothetical protein